MICGTEVIAVRYVWGIIYTIKLMGLILWACVRHPLTTSYIDYDKMTVITPKR